MMTSSAPQFSQTPVIILGGGISGLSLAYYLQEKQIPYLLLEKSTRVGGFIDSKFENGFLAETGPNGFLCNADAPLYKLSQALELKIIEANPQQKRRYIFKKVTSTYSINNLHPLPTNPLALLTTKILSWRGKLRLLREPWIRAYHQLSQQHDETLADFTCRRLGKEALDYLINPMVTGIYAGDPAELSAGAAFPKLTELEWRYGGLIRGAIKSRSSKTSRAHLYNFENGMGALIQALHAKLISSSMLLGHTVENIDYKNGQFNLQVSSVDKQSLLTTKNLILAVNANSCSELLRKMTAINLPKFNFPEIDLAPIISISVGYDLLEIPRPLDGYGFLVPANQQLHLLGAIWSSTLFSNRAPQGSATITCMLGGKRHPHLIDEPDAKLLQLLMQDLRTTMGITAEPKFISIHRWPAAIPQYRLGHQQAITKMLRQAEALPGLYFTGNYIDGISVPHCVERAAHLAEQICATWKNPVGANNKFQNQGEPLWNRSSSSAPALPD